MSTTTRDFVQMFSTFTISIAGHNKKRGTGKRKREREKEREREGEREREREKVSERERQDGKCKQEIYVCSLNQTDYVTTIRLRYCFRLFRAAEVYSKDNTIL